MTVREEWVTIELASILRAEGWRIVSVHPPGGQGPFVIPREALDRNIERNSFHPDLVAVRQRDGESRVLVAETKPTRTALVGDIAKLAVLAASRAAMLHVLFRCQKFPGGPSDGVDFDRYQSEFSGTFPIEFRVACAGETRSTTVKHDLSPYGLVEESFEMSALIRKYSKPADE